MLKSFTDAGWGGCRDTRRSTAGYLFNIGSGAISWQLTRQSVVALSTYEAVFLGLTKAAKEAICLRRLLNELNISQGKAATIIVVTTKRPVLEPTIPFPHEAYVARGVQDLGTVELKYIPTIGQLADGFTKALTRERFEWFRRAWH
jgi:hypothetical protein